jgi:hypothetical protein
MLNIPIVTYTHSNCKDVWPIYFGQLDEFLPDIESHVLSNEYSDVKYNRHTFHLYIDNEPHWWQWVGFLKTLSCPYFLYMQEDFFLYKQPNLDILRSYINFLDENKEYSYVRLIANKFLKRNLIKDNLYRIESEDPYIICMQPTIWRTSEFIKVFSTVKVADYTGDEGKKINEAAVLNNIVGSYSYHGEPLRGEAHYDSTIFPFVATGLVRRKWNTVEYKEELDFLTKKYGIDMSTRGHFNLNEKQFR